MDNAANTTVALETLNARQDVLKRAFDVVSNPLDWKAPICIHGTPATFDKLFNMLGLTLDDLLESIRHFTATEPRVTTVDGTLYITADGYRMGPAGDR